MRQQDIENLAKGQSLDENPFGDERSLYKTANDLEMDRIAGISDLDELKKEVKIRIKINVDEALRIGEIFTIGKKLCQKQKVGFKKWVSDIGEFSYETANNYMNIFRYCVGNRAIARKVPLSILHKISSPSFSDELRRYLFGSCMLDEMTNGRLVDLLEKYKQGGIEAIEAELDNLCDLQFVRKQTKNTLEIHKEASELLKNLLVKMECRGGSTKDNFISFEKRIENDYPIAREINLVLYNGVKKATESISESNKRATTIFDEYEQENSINVNNT